MRSPDRSAQMRSAVADAYGSLQDLRLLAEARGCPGVAGPARQCEDLLLELYATLLQADALGVCEREPDG